MEGLDMNLLPELLWAGHKVFQQGEIHVTRTCDDDVLLIMQKGSLNFSENGTSVTLGPGEYYIQRRGLFQTSDIASDAEYYYIHFNGHFSDNTSSLPLRGHTEPEKFSSCFECLLGTHEPKATKIQQAAAFYTVLTMLQSDAKPSENQRLISKTVALISKDLTRQFNLDELSRDSGYSKNHFINIFKSQTGKTPYEYIIDLRMNRAIQMLYDTDMPIGKISEMSGFGSYINLYKEFVKRQRCSPLEWRKKRRNLY